MSACASKSTALTLKESSETKQLYANKIGGMNRPRRRREEGGERRRKRKQPSPIKCRHKAGGFERVCNGKGELQNGERSKRGVAGEENC
mmetsp:Transcript_59916/g.131371  ORF Transcript_59916/g.131371 Transcript_59916/m.131371 type:complete len:89 (+) Transcript_59916:21-287(+)